MYAKVIKVGEKCNNKCYFCFEENKKYLLDFDLIKNELAQGRQERCEQVIFTGREPTLVENIIDIVEFAKNLDYKVIQLMSNARMFVYQQFTEDIIKAGLTELVVPIYHYKKEIHEKITGIKDSFWQAIKGIENVTKFSNANSPYFNVAVSCSIVICKENIRDLDKIIKYLKDLGIKQIFIINNKVFKINDYEKYLLKLEPYFRNNDLIINLVGFKNLPIDLEKYSYKSFIKLNKKRILLPK